MSKRRKSVSPKVKKSAVEVPVVASVTVAAEPPPVEVKPEVESKAKGAGPVASCFRCGRTGAGMLCRRCGVVLGHSGLKEAHLYSKPVNPMVGW
jgi:hypothetical protein